MLNTMDRRLYRIFLRIHLIEDDAATHVIVRAILESAAGVTEALAMKHDCLIPDPVSLIMRNEMDSKFAENRMKHRCNDCA